MNASSITLPTREIDELWFGGLDLKSGAAPPDAALKRWFGRDAKFDGHCK
jgi:hypothetical protein